MGRVAAGRPHRLVPRLAGGRETCDPWGLYRRCQADSGLAQKIGRSIGQILAEQHTQIVETDAAGWLPQQVPWPEAGTWIRERLSRVVADHGWFGGLGSHRPLHCVAGRDRALVHGDLGLHNLGWIRRPTASTASSITMAPPGRRHHDCAISCSTYAARNARRCPRGLRAAVGRRLDRDRIRLYNAACAIGYLAFRSGVARDPKSCGRTLAEDLRWVRNGAGEAEMRGAMGGGNCLMSRFCPFHDAPEGYEKSPHPESM